MTFTVTIDMGFGKNKTGVIIREIPKITLGTLAANTVVFAASGQMGTGLAEDFRMLKTEFLCNIETGGGTDAVVVGICSGDMTTTEVAEVLGVVGPPERGDIVEADVAMRPVWPLCIEHATENRPPNNGLPIVHKKPWTFSGGKGWFWFAYNPSTTTAYTDGGTVEILSTTYGVWLD